MDYLEHLKQLYILSLEWEVDGVSVWSGNGFYINFIQPHSGTDWLYCIRADFPETLDRWSVCLFEESFDTVDSFNSVLVKLNNFIQSKAEIVAEELDG